MPSGFLVLADGRCLARRWWAYDQVIKAVASFIVPSAPGDALRDWLLSLLPGPDDEAEIGYGAWVRARDEEIVTRRLDVRELTPGNQRLFHDAALEAARRYAESPEAFDWLEAPESLVDLGDMIMRGDRGEPPLSRSDCREVFPTEAKQAGPGW